MAVQQPPEEPKTAFVDKLLAGALSSFPVAGGIAGAWYEYVMEGPYNKRVTAWRASITAVVTELSEKVDGLLDDEVFLDAFVQATRAAQATHQREKLEALRNAVANSVAVDAPDADEQARFIRLVDEFSERHLLLLGWADDHGSSDAQADEQQRVNATGSWGYPLPEIAGRADLRQLLIDDLVRAHLVVGAPRSGEVVALDGEFFFGHTAELGKRFLLFISESV